MTAEYPLAFARPHVRRSVDAIASRALELLDVLHHSEDGYITLPEYVGIDADVLNEISKNDKAAELLVRARFAEWAPPSSVGRRLKLAGVVAKEGDE